MIPMINDDLAKLAVAEAMSKAIKPILDTRKPGSARANADDNLRELYETEGIDRKRISINGQSVGTLTARISTPKSGVQPEINDDAKFIQWMRTSDGGLDTIRRLLINGKTRDLVLQAAIADGELPDGCHMVEVNEPSHWLGTTLRVDKDKVAQAIAGELPSTIAGFLSGN